MGARDLSMENAQANESLTVLILRAKLGRQSDMQALYERVRPLIKKIARKAEIEQRQDVEQELFVELCRAIRRFQPAGDWPPRAEFRGPPRRETPRS